MKRAHRAARVRFETARECWMTELKLELEDSKSYGSRPCLLRAPRARLPLEICAVLRQQVIPQKVSQARRPILLPASRLFQRALDSPEKLLCLQPSLNDVGRVGCKRLRRRAPG